MNKRQLIPTEHQEQATVVAWFDQRYRNTPLAERLVAIPNGAWLAGSAVQRARLMKKMKREGVRPGFPDLILPVPAGAFHGLVIEMKRQGEKPTHKQYDWIDYLASQGYKAVWCQGATQAITMIDSYLKAEDPQ